MKQYDTSARLGCPTCDGVDPNSCVRCGGRTRLCDWWNTNVGWTYKPLPSYAVVEASQAEKGE